MDINEIKKLQETELLLLKETDRICNSLNITYYLIGGTLLGAVRHKGFIPWDVDIDIAMPRSDYERFREYWENNESDKFFYQHYTTEKNHTELHAILKLKGTEIKYKTHRTDRYMVKCDGIYMDIFPLDFAASTPEKQKHQARQIKFLSSLIQAKICRDYGNGKIRYLLKCILSVVLRPIPFSCIQRYVDKSMIKYNGSEKEYMVSMASHYSYKKQLMPYSIYGKPTRIDFEGHKFYAPNKPKEYLTRLYGNYMELPPENTRYKLIDLVEYVDYGVKGND